MARWADKNDQEFDSCFWSRKIMGTKERETDCTTDAMNILLYSRHEILRGGVRFACVKIWWIKTPNTFGGEYEWNEMCVRRRRSVSFYARFIWAVSEKMSRNHARYNVNWPFRWLRSHTWPTLTRSRSTSRGLVGLFFNHYYSRWSRIETNYRRIL